MTYAAAWCSARFCGEVNDLALIEGEFLCYWHRRGLTRYPMVEPMNPTCRCGAPATANGRECGDCFRSRIATVNNAFTPTRSLGAGQIDPDATKRHVARLDDYAAVRKEGSQPATTKRRDIETAKRRSDETGQPHRADALGRALAQTR